jgi:hypothetical protein
MGQSQQSDLHLELCAYTAALSSCQRPPRLALPLPLQLCACACAPPHLRLPRHPHCLSAHAGVLRPAQITNFQNYFVPFPNWHVLAPNIRYFYEHGVVGIFEEGTYDTGGGDLVGLKDYIIARGLREPAFDSSRAIQAYTRGYFGAGGPYVEQYMKAMVEGIEASGYYMRESFDWHAPFLTPPLLLKSANAFAAAANATTGDSGDGRFHRRCSEAAMPLMFTVLLRWDELRSYTQNVSARWPYNESKRDQFNEFSRRYQAVGATRLNEGGHDLKWLEGQLFGS